MKHEECFPTLVEKNGTRACFSTRAEMSDVSQLAQIEPCQKHCPSPPLGGSIAVAPCRRQAQQEGNKRGGNRWTSCGALLTVALVCALCADGAVGVLPCAVGAVLCPELCCSCRVLFVSRVVPSVILIISTVALLPFLSCFGFLLPLFPARALADA